MKLKLTNSNETKTLHYEKSSIAIGSGGNQFVDLNIPNLPPLHVRFVEQNGVYSVINESNDPFVSLNGLPFRKKNLRDGDFLELAPSITILIEDLGCAPPPSLVPTPAAAKSDSKPVLKPKPIKINDLDDEPEPAKHLPKGKIGGLETVPFFKSLKTIFTLAGMTIIFAAFIFGAMYTSAIQKSTREEITAAEGVADVAMALMYAQVNHLKPKKHNWSDPDFIRNNLNAVLTHDFPSLSHLDSHGQFANTPYILRTYTNTEFNHFIVIAQPTPGMTQWLTPHSALVIDSKLMQIRKINDLRTINRLLVQPTILDGSKASSVTALIEQGELLPLAKLASNRPHQGYNPPKALGLIYPGAEDRIYNAPRYYRFGETIIKRALSVNESNQIGRAHV